MIPYLFISIDISSKLAKIFKKKIVLKKTKLARGGTKKRLPSIRKIKKIGFKQNVKLEEGLKSLVQQKLYD